MTGPHGVPLDAGGAPLAPGTGVRLARLKVLASLLLVVGVAADLLSKRWMQDALVLIPGEHASEKVKDVIPGFFALEGTWNPGVTFGLAQGRTVEILALTSAATLGLLTWLLATRNPSRLLHVGLSLIISGALGNLYDRIRWHEVRDFFLVYLGTIDQRRWTWPNFNVADSCIVVGVGMVVIEALFFGPPARPAPPGSASGSASGSAPGTPS